MLCKECHNYILKFTSESQFCSKTCAAFYNNRNRSYINACQVCSNTFQCKSKLKKRCLQCDKKFDNLLNRKKQTLKIKICKSIGCKNVKEKYKQYCLDCVNNYYKLYRPRCEFTFDIEKYKEFIDGYELISIYGRYSPSNKGNNLNGVSLDHMYSVKDGFLNKISPSLISHPANCRIIKHSENSSKYYNSCITLEELHKRIIRLHAY